MKIALGGESGDHVQLAVTSYAHPGGQFVYDHNWLFADVAVRTEARAFRCHAFLRTEDFASFETELGAVLSGVAQRAAFAPSDPWVMVDVEADGQSSYRIEVSARDGGSERTAQFGLVADRAQLEELAREVSAVAARFPVVDGGPP